MQRERLLRAAASEFADVLGLAPVIDRLTLGLIPANPSRRELESRPVAIAEMPPPTCSIGAVDRYPGLPPA